ncbi:NACHT nucleoside triphosphatase [Penicillium malachiteum]|uniref:NACHT nucleoside triphosphatase n=1 Tax=Penicillium malachiteum TaxID=1324776 RepID=UPI002548F15A|nr:NACHT nucleoside triphosphatase [Penicillium malachiteum]KAJ5737600.1 NACHT nucleoside triphosphatase [Penicillium malachiteum]
MGPKGEHSGRHRWKLYSPSYFKSSEKQEKNEKTKHEPDQSDRSEPPKDPSPPKQHDGTISPLASLKAKDVNTVETFLLTTSDDLWTNALKKLPPKLQEKLRARGMDEKRTISMRDQVEEFKQEAGRLQESSKGKDWKFSLKGQDILVRDLTTRIAGWAVKIGDIAIPFASATSVAAAVWGCATLFLKSRKQGIQNFDTEKKALLSIAEKVAQAMFFGQLYSNTYTHERTGNFDVIANLRKATVDLYICVLTLLVKSLDLTSNTVTQFCRSMFENHKPSGILLDLASQKSTLNEAAGLCEVTAKALQDENFKNCLRDTELFQRQYFQKINENEQREIRDWVSNVPYASHRREIEENRVKETGNWLIQHQRFLDWIQSSSSEVLWLQGSQAGTGKTFLTANVVTYLEDHIACTGGGFAYFFCNRDENDRRRSSPVLRSLVRQLATTTSIDKSIRGSLQKLWKKSKKENLDFGRSDCQNQLLESFDTYPTTFVVLDALDEVNTEDIRVLLKDIRNNMSKTENVVKLFVASRPEVGVPHRLWPTITIQSRDNFEDIKKYVEGEVEQFIDDYHRDRLDEGSECVPAVEEKKDQIIQDVLDKCDNMFLWAALQVKRILVDCHTVEAIENVLGVLPMGLDEAYDRIFEDIKWFPDPDQELVEHTLKWIYAAPGLLQTEEILSAIRVRSNSLDFSDEASFFYLKWFGYVLESNFQGFDYEEVAFLEQRFVSDYETESYSGDHRDGDPIKAPIFMVAYFSLYEQLREWYENSAINPFQSTDHGDYLLTFAYLIENHKADPNLPPNRHSYAGAFVVAAAYRRRDMIRYYLEETNVDVNAVYSTGSYGSPLCTMISHGSLEDVSYFIETGKANVNLLHEVGGCGSALAQAAFLGKLEKVKYLVEEAGAKPDLQLKVGDYGNALIAALFKVSGKNNYRIFEYLAPHTQVNLPLLCGRYGSALAAAFALHRPDSKVNMDIVRLFIETGADVNMQHRVGEYGSPFLTAAFFVTDLDIIHYLVDECEADLHALHSTGNYGSALAAAANGGNMEVVKYLVDLGVDADCELQVGAYGSALAAAAAGRYSDPAAFKYLVDLRVDTNRELQVGAYGSALVAAAATKKLERVQYLVEKGNANVDLCLSSGSFGSALAAAAANRNFQEVEYLVEEGKANVNLLLAFGSFGSAFLAAIISPFDVPIDQEIIEISRQRGLGLYVDLAIQILGDDVTRVALAASFAPPWLRKDAFGIVKYLVDAGANVDLELQVGAYGNALAAAVTIGNLDQVKYLVRKGKANANFQHNTGSFGSALVVSIIKYSKIRKLPDDVHGIQGIILSQIDRMNFYGRSIASMNDAEARSRVESMMRSLVDIMIYLLESGANANLQLNVGPFGSALAAAAATGSLWHVKFLVENAQADVDLQLNNGSYANAYEAAIFVFFLSSSY